MSHRQSWIVGVSVVVGCVMTFLSRPSNAEEKKAAAEPTVGRYQVIKGDARTVLLVDTQTGHCWSNTDFGGPKGASPFSHIIASLLSLWC
jgi:hypothetical protein